MPKSRLQMLLRGQNLLGYRHYEDGVVERFVEKSAENGIDVFRIFDALNDVRNLQTSIAAVKRTGKHAQGTISYTVSPLHTVEAFAEMALRLRELGCDSICIKDMAALLRPQPAYDLVRAIKEKCGEATLVHVHTHATTGVTLVSLMKAVEAGCDMVDTAVSSLSLGPGHNPTESMIEMLEGTGYETRVDLERVLKISTHFAKIRPRYKEFFSENTGVDTEIFKSQIPGGMISNMESQLKGQGAGERLKEVLEEVPRVRQDSGYPPLVTPTSQIVGSQAVFNVLMGKYKVLTGEFADLMLGYYGATIGPKDSEVLKLAEAHAKKPAITVRPADLLKPEWENLSAAANALKGANGSDEDVLTYAMFPQVAPKFFETRAQGRKNVGKDPAAKAAEAKVPEAKAVAGGAALSAKVNYVITLNGKEHRVSVAPEKS
jgi:methylmalonyl-CoA carboxyltransferase 5S subunit